MHEYIASIWMVDNYHTCHTFKFPSLSLTSLFRGCKGDVLDNNIVRRGSFRDGNSKSRHVEKSDDLVGEEKKKGKKESALIL
jgi:hypothetical protein